jgi:excisionase family DNA binding protein
MGMETKSDGENAAPDFMTAAEVAAWLRVGLSTVYAWTLCGQIPYVKLNGIVRFQRNQLVEWMQQRTRCPDASSHPVSERIHVARPRQLTHRTLLEAAIRVKKRLVSTKNTIPHGGGH